MEFITITDDGNKVTSPMPDDESIVEVKLTDGRIIRAVYESNVMEPGDWDFGQVDENNKPVDGDSLAADVVAWRKIQ